MEGELTWRQIRDSRIYRDGARAAMWVSPLLLSGALWLLNDIRSNTVEAVAEIRTTVSDVVDTQNERAEDNERFQTEMVNFRTVVLAADREAELRDIETGKDIARIKGILEAQERRASASIGSPWSGPMVASEN